MSDCQNPYTGPTARWNWLARRVYQPERRDAKICPLPKSIMLVEILGMGLLTLAWLSLNQYVQLPAPIASPTAALVMLFAGIVLMIPAAIVVMWRMAQIVAPQLTHSPKPESLSDREKRNDADH
ncbi:YbjC family protein [Klebsiella pneumoniae]|nr:YbjC family protein [Klebsiella pneumoniae]